MAQIRRARMTEGPVGRTLFALTFPMLFGVFGMIAFNLADTFFVGQLGARELAAISFTFPVVFLVSSLAMGLGVGTSAAISRAIGAGDQQRVQRLATDALGLGLLVASVVIVIGLLTIDPVFRLLGATAASLGPIRDYMTIWYVGIIFVIIPMIGNNAIRATGDMVTPSAIMLVVVFVNIALDPLLIFGIGPFPRMELAGAALATLIARAITLVVALWVLICREQMVTFALPRVGEVLRSWREILHVGIPTAATQMIMPLSIGVITGLLATHSEAAVAGFGAATRVELLSLMLLVALSIVLGPFVGQNWGAGERGRVETGVRYSQGFALIWGVCVFVFMAVAARPIAAVFNDDPAVVGAMALYLQIASLGTGAQGVLLLSNAVLNTLGKPLHASVLMLAQAFLLYIPLAYLGSYLDGLSWIFSAAATANLVAGAAAYLWLRLTFFTLGPAPAGPSVQARRVPAA